MPQSAAADNRWRRVPALRLAGLLTTALVVALAGCEPGNHPEPAPTPPATSAPASTTTPPALDTAQTYAEATVAAWAAPDLLRLRDLATPQVRQSLIELPGPPDPHWTLAGCDESETHSDCAFYNRNGDWLVLTIDHERLTDRAATTGVDFQVTAYPEEPIEYVTALVDAWRQGNQARMQQLAVPAVVTVFTELAPPGSVPDNIDYQLADQTGTALTVVVMVDGHPVSTTVRTSSLGQPQAIRAAQAAAPPVAATSDQD